MMDGCMDDGWVGGESPPVLRDLCPCIALLCKLQRGFLFPFEGESSGWIIFF